MADQCDFYVRYGRAYHNRCVFNSYDSFILNVKKIPYMCMCVRWLNFSHEWVMIHAKVRVNVLQNGVIFQLINYFNPKATASVSDWSLFANQICSLSDFNFWYDNKCSGLFVRWKIHHIVSHFEKKWIHNHRFVLRSFGKIELTFSFWGSDMSLCH